jgi:short-subunit dehydrogenase
MNTTSLITGATRGLGRAIARNLARRGHRLVLVARNTDALEAVAESIKTDSGHLPLVLGSDLGSPGAAAVLFEELQQRGVAVDMLVNNAGAGLNGLFVDIDPAATRDMLALNIDALTELCHYFVSPMVERGNGRVLNVASVAAYQPGGPHMAAYYASKAYVLSLSRALHAELKGSGVSVTALCPAPMQTGFFEAGADFSGIALNRLPKLGVEQVAEIGVKAMLAGREVALPWLLARLLAFAGMLPPRAVAMEINRRLLADGGAS